MIQTLIASPATLPPLSLNLHICPHKKFPMPEEIKVQVWNIAGPEEGEPPSRATSKETVEVPQLWVPYMSHPLEDQQPPMTGWLQLTSATLEGAALCSHLNSTYSGYGFCFPVHNASVQTTMGIHWSYPFPHHLKAASWLKAGMTFWRLLQGLPVDNTLWSWQNDLQYAVEALKQQPMCVTLLPQPTFMDKKINSQE